MMHDNVRNLLMVPFKEEGADSQGDKVGGSERGKRQGGRTTM